MVTATVMGNLKYFKVSEFDSPDVPGSGSNMDEDFLFILDNIREDCDFPFIVNSGFRTTSHNRHVGGKPNSAHTEIPCKAVDIKTDSRRQQALILITAALMGIERFGLDVNGRYVHIDKSEDLPSPAIWYYT